VPPGLLPAVAKAGSLSELRPNLAGLMTAEHASPVKPVKGAASAMSWARLPLFIVVATLLLLAIAMSFAPMSAGRAAAAILQRFQPDAGVSKGEVQLLAQNAALGPPGTSGNYISYPVELLRYLRRKGGACCCHWQRQQAAPLWRQSRRHVPFSTESGTIWTWCRAWLGRSR